MSKCPALSPWAAHGLNSYLLCLFCCLCEIRARGGLTSPPDMVKQLTPHTATVSSAHSQPPSWHRAGRSWDRQERALLSYQCLMGTSSADITLQRAGRSIFPLHPGHWVPQVAVLPVHPNGPMPPAHPKTPCSSSCTSPSRSARSRWTL